MASNTAWVWNPAIYSNGSMYFLPRPVLRFQVGDEWNVDRQKVPKKQGEQIVGHSKNAVKISVSGLFGVIGPRGTSEPELLISEGLMYPQYELLRARCDISSEATKFELFKYYDPYSGTYRKYKSVSVLNLSADLGDNDRITFPYSIDFIADDPVIYSTAPGM